ncbi:MAG: hypothetical protein RBR82_00730 [Pseudomonas sp.]|nr:hypothetical protein [Pseudomonas sp.]
MAFVIRNACVGWLCGGWVDYVAGMASSYGAWVVVAGWPVLWAQPAVVEG